MNLNISKVVKKISYKGFRQGDIRHSQADIYMIKKYLKYKPTVSFDRGLKKSVEWFKNKNV